MRHLPNDNLLESAKMENLFTGVSLALMAGAVATYVSIIRDVLPNLAPEERERLKHYFDFSAYWQLRTSDRALGKAWNLHAQLFPNSHKRLLCATLFILAALSVIAYPLWLAVR